LRPRRKGGEGQREAQGTGSTRCEGARREARSEGAGGSAPFGKRRTPEGFIIVKFSIPIISLVNEVPEI
jgi:hypothetical protein